MRAHHRRAPEFSRRHSAYSDSFESLADLFLLLLLVMIVVAVRFSINESPMSGAVVEGTEISRGSAQAMPRDALLFFVTFDGSKPLVRLVEAGTDGYRDFMPSKDGSLPDALTIGEREIVARSRVVYLVLDSMLDSAPYSTFFSLQKWALEAAPRVVIGFDESGGD